jgi:hypothetical protein
LSGHTPGPWEIFTIASEAGVSFRIFARETDIVHMPMKWSNEANARLIAAAPDLLEALKAAVRIAEEARRQWDAAPMGMRTGKLLIALAGGCKGYRHDIDAIHAAIAKAEGRS